MVGKNIKYYRRKNQLTQDDVAKLCNVTRQAVSNWETGKTKPDIQTLSLIAKGLEITEEDLIYGPGEREKKVEAKLIDKKSFKVTVNAGETVGASLAVVLSYLKWKSIGWAILHGVLGWIYVIYYAIKY